MNNCYGSKVFISKFDEITTKQNGSYLLFKFKQCMISIYVRTVTVVNFEWCIYFYKFNQQIKSGYLNQMT